MKRKYYNLHEWIYEYKVKFKEGDECRFIDIYNYKDNIKNIYERLIKLNLPCINDYDDIKQMFFDLKITIPSYFNKKFFLYKYLMASVYNLYSMPARQRKPQNLSCLEYFEWEIENQLIPFKELKEEEQSVILKILNKWKKCRSNKHVKTIISVHMFHNHLDELRDGHRKDLINDVFSKIKGTKEETKEVLKDKNQKIYGILNFFYKRYFSHYYLHEKENNYNLHNHLQNKISVSHELFYNFIDMNEMDFYFLNIFVPIHQKIAIKNNCNQKSFEIKKSYLLENYNTYLESEENFMYSKKSALTKNSLVWIRFIKDIENVHPFIKMKIRSVIADFGEYNEIKIKI